MSKFNKKCFEASAIHEALGPMWKGFRRVLGGAAVAGLMAAAGYCFTKIPAMHGYMAVAVFAGGAAVLGFALRWMWVIGGGKKRAGAFDE